MYFNIANGGVDEHSQIINYMPSKTFFHELPARRTLVESDTWARIR